MTLSIDRRQFIKSLGLGLGAAAVGAYCRTAVAAAKKPNIIFILADDLGYGDLGCFGQKIIKTPRLDAMAKEGMKLTRHYAGATVCAPSRCCLMTGYHGGHAAIRGNTEVKPEGQAPLPADAVTVASLLKKAGYATGAAGKWGLGAPGSEGAPGRQGFDFFYGYLCQRMAHNYFPHHLWKNEEMVVLDGNGDGGTAAYAQDLIIEESLRFIRDHKDQPFFLYLPFTIPHAELTAPEEEMTKYDGAMEEAKPFGQPGPYKLGGYNYQEKPHAAFAAMVSRLDGDVGRVMDLVKDLGLDKDTLVIFSSDNGPHQEGGADPDFFDSNGLFRGYKRDLYEGGIRVPTIARWPGRIREGSTCDHASAFWDFLPTCAEVAGVDPPQDIDGISYLPALLGRAQAEHPYLYWEFHEQGGKQAVCAGKWKALRLNAKKDPDGLIELYDLEKDPGETTNVAEQEKAVVEKMRNVMAEARTPSPVAQWNFTKDKREQ